MFTPSKFLSNFFETSEITVITGRVSEKFFILANEIWLPGGLVVSNRKHSHHHQHRTQYNLNTLRSHQLQLKFSERINSANEWIDNFIILLVDGQMLPKFGNYNYRYWYMEHTASVPFPSL